MAEERTFDWASGLQLLGSLVGVLVLIGVSVAGTLVISLEKGEWFVAVSTVQTTSLILFFASLGFVGILLIPSVLYAAKRILGTSSGKEMSWHWAGWLIVLFPVFLGLGYLADWETGAGRFLLAISHVSANGVAVFWILNLGRKGLPKGSAQRFWGVFGSGMTLAPALALLFEFLLLVLIGGIWYAYLVQHPALRDQITHLVERLPQSAASPAILERMANKYLFNPGILASVFSYVAVLIPLVEELIKPLGLWLLMRRKLTPVQGFTLGMVSGAGYALFENLTLSANANTWTVVMISRFGTTAVHMLTTGFVGWGLASTWSEGSYARLAKAFLTSVVFHGVWNGLNILGALGQFSGAREAFGPFGYWMAQYAPVGLFILAVGAIYGLLRSNRFLRRAIMSQVE
ncbi:MAG: PrsW family glutamic-type intramembrane protease [Anaerolineales bacterium]